MTFSHGFGNIFETFHSVSEVFKITVLALKSHTPAAYQRSKSIVKTQIYRMVMCVNNTFPSYQDNEQGNAFWE